MKNEIAIVGYEQDGHCEHCGRALRHCIRISDGRLVGATCFDRVLTKPRVYQGKAYRVGSDAIIRYAKIVAFYTTEAASRRFGVEPHMLRFEAAA